MTDSEGVASAMARNFVGYDRAPLYASWPDDARISVSLVLNYEEDCEQAIPAGDCLSREGEATPKMMSNGPHCRIFGRPTHSVAVQRFIECA